MSTPFGMTEEEYSDFIKEIRHQEMERRYNRIKREMEQEERKRRRENKAPARKRRAFIRR